MDKVAQTISGKSRQMSRMLRLSQRKTDEQIVKETKLLLQKSQASEEKA